MFEIDDFSPAEKRKMENRGTSYLLGKGWLEEGEEVTEVRVVAREELE